MNSNFFEELREDLLMRATEQDSNGAQVVNVSASLWDKLTELCENPPKTLRDDLKIVRWDGGDKYKAWEWCRKNSLVFLCSYLCSDSFCVRCKAGDFDVDTNIDYVVTKSAIIPLSELVEV